MRPKQKQPKKPKLVTVRGVVELIDYHDDHNPFDAVVITDSDENFYLDIPRTGTRLRDCIDQYVQVTGVIFKRDDIVGIAAKRIMILDPLEEDGEDELSNHIDLYEDFYDYNDDIQEITRFSCLPSRIDFPEDF